MLWVIAQHPRHFLSNLQSATSKQSKYVFSRFLQPIAHLPMPGQTMPLKWEPEMRHTSMDDRFLLQDCNVKLQVWSCDVLGPGHVSKTSGIHLPILEIGRFSFNIQPNPSTHKYQAPILMLAVICCSKRKRAQDQHGSSFWRDAGLASFKHNNLWGLDEVIHKLAHPDLGCIKLSHLRVLCYCCTTPDLKTSCRASICCNGCCPIFVCYSSS